jgi:hypothetical protein
VCHIRSAGDGARQVLCDNAVVQICVPAHVRKYNTCLFPSLLRRPNAVRSCRATRAHHEIVRKPSADLRERRWIAVRGFLCGIVADSARCWRHVFNPTIALSLSIPTVVSEFVRNNVGRGLSCDLLATEQRSEAISFHEKWRCRSSQQRGHVCGICRHPWSTSPSRQAHLISCSARC